MKAPTRKTNPEPVQEEAPPRRDGKATVFDIKTCGCDGERLEKDDAIFEPDSRLKDPEKIAASIAEKGRNGLASCLGLENRNRRFNRCVRRRKIRAADW